MAVRTPRRVHPLEIAAVVGGSMVLLGSWIDVVRTHGVPRWEDDVFRAINGLPGAIWPIVWGPMQLGSLVGSLVVVALTYAVSRNGRLALAALVASQAAFWSAKIVKVWVDRGRPGAFYADAHIREHAGGVGYVSGHTAVAFALAAVLAPSLPPRWRPVALGVAVLIAFARVYAGAHLPLDVVGGAGLGLLCGTLSRWAFGLGGEGLPARVR
jgi:membrane-associated phospholipid phosphatase